jgi:hypothetical protein
VDEKKVSAGEISAGWTAEDAGARMPGAVTGGDGALRGNKACGGAGDCSAAAK